MQEGYCLKFFQCLNAAANFLAWLYHVDVHNRLGNLSYEIASGGLTI